MFHRSKKAGLFSALTAMALMGAGNMNSARAQYGFKQSDRQWSFSDRIIGRQAQTVETHLNDRGSELKPPPSKLIQPVNQNTGQSCGLGPMLNGSVDEGYFTVPNWFGTQPKPFERPVETFKTQIELAAPVRSFGYAPWNSYGTWVHPGYYHPGYLGRYNYAWGYPLGSPFIGPFGSYSLRPGSITSSAVSQSAPSKPSGNYYAPANIDTSASGSYYAAGTPYLIPIMAPKQAPKNYWGSGGSPFPKDLNTTPWSK